MYIRVLEPRLTLHLGNRSHPQGRVRGHPGVQRGEPQRRGPGERGGGAARGQSGFHFDYNITTVKCQNTEGTKKFDQSQCHAQGKMPGMEKEEQWKCEEKK